MGRVIVCCAIAVIGGLITACSSGMTRPAYSEISAISIKRCGSVEQINDVRRVQAIVSEINSTRGEGWEFVRGKPGAQSLIISLLGRGQVIAELLVDEDAIVEFEIPGRQRSGFSRRFPSDKLPLIRKLRQETAGSCWAAR